MHLIFQFLQVISLGYGYLAAKSDLESFVIPNVVTIRILGFSLVSQLLCYRPEVFCFSVLIFCVHLSLSLVNPKAFGMGDVKFLGAISLQIPTIELLALWIFLSYIFGLVHGIWLKWAKKTTRIPFGVSIYGAWVLICVGEWGSVEMDYSW